MLLAKIVVISFEIRVFIWNKTCVVVELPLICGSTLMCQSFHRRQVPVDVLSLTMLQ